MDIREAVKALDAYTDTLVSMSLLLEANYYQQQDADIRGKRESLLAELRQTSKDAINLATKIVGSMGAPCSQVIDPTTASVKVNAAISRVVAASNRAGYALPTTVDEGRAPTAFQLTIQKFYRMREKYGDQANLHMDDKE